MGDPGLVGAIIIGIAFLTLAAAIAKKKNKNKTREQQLKERFEEYDQKMKKFRR